MMEDLAPFTYAMGWAPNPQAVQAVLDRLPMPFLTDHITRAPQPKNVFLWDLCRDVTGNLLPPRNQGQVGSCVSFGFASAVEHLICVEIANGDSEEFKPIAQEVIYGGSRVEVGHGQVSGDGSVGAWAAEFINKWGVVARAKYPDSDLSEYSESRCRYYGTYGVPSSIEDLARERPVKTVSLVRSASEAYAALANGYPIAVCSNQGFTMKRDDDGFARPSGTWNHCMCIVGYQKGTRPGFFILNSWGPDAHTGPRGKGDPSPAGFWADADVVHGMLSQGDSWAVSSFVGFPSRTVNPL